MCKTSSHCKLYAPSKWCSASEAISATVPQLHQKCSSGMHIEVLSNKTSSHCKLYAPSKWCSASEAISATVPQLHQKCSSGMHKWSFRRFERTSGKPKEKLQKLFILFSEKYMQASAFCFWKKKKPSGLRQSCTANAHMEKCSKWRC